MRDHAASGPDQKLRQKAIGDRPDPARLRTILRRRKPLAVMFSDDGIIPRNPRFPLTVYRGIVKLTGAAFKPAAVIDTLFETNGWGRSWRDTVYDFVHYHSQIHEVMGVARGSATLEFGGVKGRRMKLRGGAAAGTGHRLIDASRNFMIVGADPNEDTYDECTDARDRIEAAKRVAKPRRPEADPVFGSNGPLMALWRGLMH